jgi:exosome complex component CSL4
MSSNSEDQPVDVAESPVEVPLSHIKSVESKVVPIKAKKELAKASGSDKKPETIPAEEDIMESESIFVMPGDFIGTTEEFTAGDGTYVNVSDIFSLNVGYVNIDRKSRKISIVPKTDVPPELEEGDIVVAEVINMRDSVALVSIGAIKGKGEREFLTNGPAAIHVSNVKDSYVKNLSYEFSMLDIVKAKVINTQNMRLSTAEKSLGVMKAYCSRCRTALAIDENKLKCPSCGRTETRKISSDYGTGIV